MKKNRIWDKHPGSATLPGSRTFENTHLKNNHVGPARYILQEKRLEKLKLFTFYFYTITHPLASIFNFSIPRWLRLNARIWKKKRKRKERKEITPTRWLAKNKSPETQRPVDPCIGCFPPGREGNGKTLYLGIGWGWC